MDKANIIESKKKTKRIIEKTNHPLPPAFCYVKARVPFHFSRRSTATELWHEATEEIPQRKN